MKQVLMVAFHYPPIATSAGALRACAFVSNLPSHGWHAHVLAPTPCAYPEIDYNVVQPAAGDAHRCWALDAQRHLGWRERYSELVAIPDRWSSWAPAAIARGLYLVKQHHIEAIWSTYPIASSHLIAATVARISGLPWIAEFRDPVALDECAPIQRRAQRFIERLTIRQAARSVFVTPGARADYAKRFPARSARFALIPNGYDESLEPAFAAAPDRDRAEATIRILHSGHLYRHGRNPAALLEAVARLKKQGAIDASRLRIILRNSHEELLYQQAIDRFDVSDIVTLEPRIPHSKALQEQRAVDGLLLFQGAVFNRQIPAKLFEYLRARRPVLALVDERGDTAALLEELGGARCVAPDNAEAIAEALVLFIQDLRGNTRDGPACYPLNEAALSAYSRARQTATLAQLLDDVTTRQGLPVDRA